jgi:hypothetical protein
MIEARENPRAEREFGDCSGLHRRLARFNAQRLEPAGPGPVVRGEREHEHELLIAVQNDFVERERERVHRAAEAAPREPGDFVAWFCALQENGAGQGDCLFPWLARCASLVEMRWFLSQEAAGEAGFDDLVALTQVKLPTRAKLELARNYWDEMGRGVAGSTHGRLLERIIHHLGVRVDRECTVWPALAVGNLMMALASQRHYVYQSIGALGVIELTAPDRVAQVACGLRRLGVPAPERAYFEVHATLDRKHSRSWNEEVIAPLIAEDPGIACWIAEGALMRLAAGARCFASYREVLVPERALAASSM